MSFLNFKFVAVALAYVLASAAMPYKRQDFQLNNGVEAQQQNAQFASLTPDSPCSNGENACVDGSFATCINSAFVLIPCAGGQTCMAIPNLSSPGTTIACTNPSSSKRSVQWLQQNGPAAKALNDQYATLTTNSTCTNDGDIACIGGEFATCYEGRYSTSPCANGWECAAIPNEWSEGTTTTCDTIDDISWRFSVAGVSES